MGEIQRDLPWQNPLQRCWFQRLTLIAIALLQSSLTDLRTAYCQEPRLLARPVAIAINRERDEVFIANSRVSAITVIDCATMQTRTIAGRWSGLVDMAIAPTSNCLVAVGTAPPSVFSISMAKKTPVANAPSSGLSATFSPEFGGEGTLNDPAADFEHEIATVELAATPARVAVSLDGRWSCVSMTWDHAVCIVPLTSDGYPQQEGLKRVPLEFPPKELLALPEERFLIADAFGGQLAVVDATSGSVIAVHEMACHHIGGMARDESGQRVLITHQRLSKVAESSRDDIHWGTLIQNAVAFISEDALTNSTELTSSSVQIRQLGDVGNGAGDPAGIVVWGQGDFAVAVAGTNQVAVWKNTARVPIFVTVGLMPTDLVYIDPAKLLCVNTLEDTASLIDYSNGIRVVSELGTPRVIETPVDRGEAAFFSAGLSHDGWMSCSSCHVDGHSPDLLADTLGDGRFGNPKRIPSLLNSSVTGPWAWDGSKSTLELQIRQTLETTMHRDERSRVAGSSDDDVANDITAYLRTLSPPVDASTSDAAVAAGAEIFGNRGCAKCHDPGSNYTSPQTYEVGVRDEVSTKSFNPPSLNGLKHRRAYFHDARFRSLDDLLQTHPHAKAPATPEERSHLKAFLMTL